MGKVFVCVSLVIPQFVLLTHIRSLGLSSGHSGPVLTLRTNDAAHNSLPRPPHSPTRRWWIRTSVSLLHLHVKLRLSMYSVLIFFFLQVMLPSNISKLPTDTPVRGFPTVWKLLLLHYSLLRVGLHPKIFYLFFYLLYFVLPLFEEIGFPFWVPGVLPQFSEIVLWKLFNIQRIFWWICRGESGLPVLFLHHLVTASSTSGPSHDLSHWSFFFPPANAFYKFSITAWEKFENYELLMGNAFFISVSPEPRLIANSSFRFACKVLVYTSYSSVIYTVPTFTF